MWLLKSDDGNLIYLKPNHTLTVGRNKGDIVLPDDQSISRVHARITVKPVAVPDISKISENSEPLSTCTIVDPNSKYGNFIIKDGNPDVKITEEGYTVQHNDRIRFGLQNYIFTVLHVPIITATSGLTESEKNQLKEIIDAIDGNIIYNWTTICTHLTVETPTISEKLSCALAACTPIVPIDYWRAVLRSFQKNEELPEPVEFAASINSKIALTGKACVKPNPLRKTCLQNLTFLIFKNEDYRRYHRMIKLAGGRSVKDIKKIREFNVSDKNVIVVQLIESNTTQVTNTGDEEYLAVCAKLRECRRRTIPVSEIALAILYGSSEKYCNPSYDYAELIRNRQSQIPEPNAPILALDTQDVDPPELQNNVRRVIIDESMEQSTDIKNEPLDNLRSIDASSESLASCSSISDSIGSLKLVSLNHEIYMEEEFEFKRPSMSTGIPAKRSRVEEMQTDEQTKKIRLGISDDERSRKSNISHSSEEFNENLINKFDDDIDIEDVKIEMPQEQDKRDKSLAKNRDGKLRHIVPDSHWDSEIEGIGAFGSLEPKRETRRSCSPPSELDEKRVSTTDDGETSRKRKIGRTDTSPSWNMKENPSKRNKALIDNDRQIPQQPQPGPSRKKPDFPLLRKFKKNEAVQENWTHSKEYQPLDTSDLSDDGRDSTERNYAHVTVFYQESDDTNPLTLLRIRNPGDDTDTSGRKIGKCFKKRYTNVPVRVNLYKGTDNSAWDIEADEEPSTSRKVSPNSTHKIRDTIRV